VNNLVLLLGGLPILSLVHLRAGLSLAMSKMQMQHPKPNPKVTLTVISACRCCVIYYSGMRSGSLSVNE